MNTAAALRCVLLASTRHDFGVELAMACPGIECVALEPVQVGVPLLNPFSLSEVDRADAILVSSQWYDWLQHHHPDRTNDVLRRLERAGVLIGLDASDDFNLGFPPSIIDRFATVLKFQGVYRDRDLYNYEVGCHYPGANWTEKRRSRAARYSAEALDKVRLSLPCFTRDLAPIRRAARVWETTSATRGMRMTSVERSLRDLAEVAFEPTLAAARQGRRSYEVYCLGALTHVQRVETLRMLQGFSGTRGITRIHPLPGGLGDAPDQDELECVFEAAREYRCDGKGRARYLLSLCRHQVAVAPTGWGEITYRHAEAWRTGGVLVCQDLGHVEMMCSVRDDENAVFVRPDLSDLASAVRGLLGDRDRARRLARAGRREFRAWGARWKQHLYAGIEQPVRASLA